MRRKILCEQRPKTDISRVSVDRSAIDLRVLRNLLKRVLIDGGVRGGYRIRHIGLQTPRKTSILLTLSRQSSFLNRGSRCACNHTICHLRKLPLVGAEAAQRIPVGLVARGRCNLAEGCQSPLAKRPLSVYAAVCCICDISRGRRRARVRAPNHGANRSRERVPRRLKRRWSHGQETRRYDEVAS